MNFIQKILSLSDSETEELSKIWVSTGKTLLECYQIIKEKELSK